jgi:hypothetical protein
MATPTYDLIASQTLGSSASSITFSSIAASWTDLRIVLTATSDSGGPGVQLRFNGDSATNYSVTTLDGYNGAGVYTTYSANWSYIYINANGGALSTTYPSLYDINVFSYAGSTYKTSLISNAGDKNGNTPSTVSAVAALWRSTAAITSLTLLASSNNFATGTTASLYGIKAA